MTEEATARPIEDRYGRPADPARRRRTTILIAALAVATLGVLAWIGIGAMRDPVQWQDVGYHVQGSDRVDITFDVFMAPGARAECRLHALNSQFAEVGVQTIVLGAVSTRGQRTTTTVSTAETAVTGVVDTCRLIGAGDG